MADEELASSGAAPGVGPAPMSEPLRAILQQAIDEGATDIHFDPIETGKLVRFRIDGIIHETVRLPMELRQLESDEGRGMTIYDGLRTLLRMDPDAIVVGEIRDQPSAVTAARAALSGRRVLATVHAPQPAIAIDALRQLSVPRYVLGGALRLLITQDLVRRLCPHCRQRTDVTPDQQRLFERQTLLHTDA